MATQLKEVDVAVIGLGAAGGVAVLPLARAGLKVAGIEAGTWMGPRDYRADEIYNNVRRLVTSVPKAQREIPTVRASPIEKARQAAAQHPMMNAVGGTSIHYWAQSWRLKPWDFKTRSESIRRYGPGSIPQGSTLEDWPISYDELEPYYDTIEWEVGVSGGPAIYKARSIRKATSLKAHANAIIRCRRCEARNSSITCRLRPHDWAGIPSIRPLLSIRSFVIIVRGALITAFAQLAAVTSTLSAPLRSRPFLPPSKPKI